MCIYCRPGRVSCRPTRACTLLSSSVLEEINVKQHLPLGKALYGFPDPRNATLLSSKETDGNSLTDDGISENITNKRLESLEEEDNTFSDEFGTLIDITQNRTFSSITRSSEVPVNNSELLADLPTLEQSSEPSIPLVERHLDDAIIENTNYDSTNEVETFMCNDSEVERLENETAFNNPGVNDSADELLISTSEMPSPEEIFKEDKLDSLRSLITNPDIGLSKSNLKQEFTNQIDDMATGREDKKKVLELMSLNFNSSADVEKAKELICETLAAKEKKATTRKTKKRRLEMLLELESNDASGSKDNPKYSLLKTNPITQALKRVRKEPLPISTSTPTSPTSALIQTTSIISLSSSPTNIATTSPRTSSPSLRSLKSFSSSSSLVLSLSQPPLSYIGPSVPPMATVPALKRIRRGNRRSASEKDSSEETTSLSEASEAESKTEEIGANMKRKFKVRTRKSVPIMSSDSCSDPAIGDKPVTAESDVESNSSFEPPQIDMIRVFTSTRGRGRVKRGKAAVDLILQGKSNLVETPLSVSRLKSRSRLSLPYIMPSGNVEASPSSDVVDSGILPPTRQISLKLDAMAANSKRINLITRKKLVNKIKSSEDDSPVGNTDRRTSEPVLKRKKASKTVEVQCNEIDAAPEIVVPDEVVDGKNSFDNKVEGVILAVESRPVLKRKKACKTLEVQCNEINAAPEIVVPDEVVDGKNSFDNKVEGVILAVESRPVMKRKKASKTVEVQCNEIGAAPEIVVPDEGVDGKNSFDKVEGVILAVESRPVLTRKKTSKTVEVQCNEIDAAPEIVVPDEGLDGKNSFDNKVEGVILAVDTNTRYSSRTQGKKQQKAHPESFVKLKNKRLNKSLTKAEEPLSSEPKNGDPEEVDTVNKGRTRKSRLSAVGDDLKQDVQEEIQKRRSRSSTPVNTTCPSKDNKLPKRQVLSQDSSIDLQVPLLSKLDCAVDDNKTEIPGSVDNSSLPSENTDIQSSELTIAIDNSNSKDDTSEALEINEDDASKKSIGKKKKKHFRGLKYSFSSAAEKRRRLAREARKAANTVPEDATGSELIEEEQIIHSTGNDNITSTEEIALTLLLEPSPSINESPKSMLNSTAEESNVSIKLALDESICEDTNVNVIECVENKDNPDTVEAKSELETIHQTLEVKSFDSVEKIAVLSVENAVTHAVPAARRNTRRKDQNRDESIIISETVLVTTEEDKTGIPSLDSVNANEENDKQEIGKSTEMKDLVHEIVTDVAISLKYNLPSLENKSTEAETQVPQTTGSRDAFPLLSAANKEQMSSKKLDGTSLQNSNIPAEQRKVVSLFKKSSPAIAGNSAKEYASNCVTSSLYYRPKVLEEPLGDQSKSGPSTSSASDTVKANAKNFVSTPEINPSSTEVVQPSPAFLKSLSLIRTEDVESVREENIKKSENRPKINIQSLTAAFNRKKKLKLKRNNDLSKHDQRKSDIGEFESPYTFVASPPKPSATPTIAPIRIRTSSCIPDAVVPPTEQQRPVAPFGQRTTRRKACIAGGKRQLEHVFTQPTPANVRCAVREDSVMDKSDAVDNPGNRLNISDRPSTHKSLVENGTNASIEVQIGSCASSVNNSAMETSYSQDGDCTNGDINKSGILVESNGTDDNVKVILKMKQVSCGNIVVPLTSIEGNKQTATEKNVKHETAYGSATSGNGPVHSDAPVTASTKEVSYISNHPDQLLASAGDTMELPTQPAGSVILEGGVRKSRRIGKFYAPPPLPPQPLAIALPVGLHDKENEDHVVCIASSSSMVSR